MIVYIFYGIQESSNSGIFMARVLIVDDNRFDRELLQSMLDQEKHEAFQAKDGFEALEAIHNFNPDIILLDIYMPDKEGIETINEIIELFPDLPIVIISSADSFYLKMAMELGAKHSFTKPPDPIELNEVILQLTN